MTDTNSLDKAGAAERDRFLDAWVRPTVASSGWPEVDAGIAYLSKLRANLNVIRDGIGRGK